ncbi:glycosyltransferase family A protein [Kitasatospora cinereorecta]|uniref:Glycosyltransferase family A protein n=1 Tax=Kitasatospora cinereorecta TaxID=285560 RepID=A0ABW0VJB3_9ACTN
MNGYDRRTAAACPRYAARDSFYTPVRVVELDLDEPSELRSPGGLGPVDPDGRVLALVRLHGHPLGLVKATGAAGETATLCRALVDAAYRELHVPARSTATPAARRSRVARARVPAGHPLVSVIVCTRDRADMLPDCLDALTRIRYPNLELIVVDNNDPDVHDTENVVRAGYPDTVRYLREPVRGASRARNRGLAAAHGEICAFTDDDTVADPGWIGAVVEAFQADRRVGCVTGLMLPAELDTEAQAIVETYGGPTRGFAPFSASLRERLDDPLLRFSVGRFGAGANMAFRTDVLRRIGGFDERTGPGTPTRGGEDLLAFLRVLTAGHTVTYHPDGLIWHRHRRTMAALETQVFGFGTGYGACLAAAVSQQPSLLASLLRLLPYGLWRWAAARRRHSNTARSNLSIIRQESLRRLSRLEARGLVYGPFCYALSVWRKRGTAAIELGGRS